MAADKHRTQVLKNEIGKGITDDTNYHGIRPTVPAEAYFAAFEDKIKQPSDGMTAAERELCPLTSASADEQERIIIEEAFFQAH